MHEMILPSKSILNTRCPTESHRQQAKQHRNLRQNTHSSQCFMPNASRFWGPHEVRPATIFKTGFQDLDFSDCFVQREADVPFVPGSLQALPRQTSLIRIDDWSQYGLALYSVSTATSTNETLLC